MSKPRNFYTREFKHKAVELSYAKGSIKQTCKDLDISLSSLVRWRSELKQYGKNSFSGKGNLKLTDKVEWVYKHKYQTRSQAELSVFKWIETWYNRKRLHSALGLKSIEEFEQEINNQKLAA